MPLTYDSEEVLKEVRATRADWYQIVLDRERGVIQYRYREYDAAGNIVDSHTREEPLPEGVAVSTLAARALAKHPRALRGSV